MHAPSCLFLGGGKQSFAVLPARSMLHYGGFSTRQINSYTLRLLVVSFSGPAVIRDAPPPWQQLRRDYLLQQPRVLAVFGLLSKDLRNVAIKTRRIFHMAYSFIALNLSSRRLSCWSATWVCPSPPSALKGFFTFSCCCRYGSNSSYLIVPSFLPSNRPVAAWSVGRSR